MTLPPVTTVTDAAAVLGITAMGFLETLTKDDLTGPHALLLGALAVIVVLWRNAGIREKNEEKRRSSAEEAQERRHKEALNMQKENSAKLADLTMASMRVTSRVSNAIDALVTEFQKRPCSANLTRPERIDDLPNPNPETKP